MTKPTLKLRTQPASSEGPPVVARTISPERLDRLHDMARANKRHPTEPQKALWAVLAEQRTGGFKFKRQQVVGNTLVDFACPARWLVVEINGDASEEFNQRKDRKLNETGIRVMRFAPERVMDDIEAVQAEITAELLKPFTKPQPVRRAVTRPVQYSDAEPTAPLANDSEPPISDAINALITLCTAEELEGEAETFGANYVHIFDAAMPNAIREAGISDDALLFWSTEANDLRRAEEGFADQAAKVAIAFPVQAEPEQTLAEDTGEIPAATELAEISAELAPEPAAETPSDIQSNTPDIDPEETKPTDA